MDAVDVNTSDTVGRICAQVRASPAVYGIRIVGIDGPSGAGKSTLARALGGALDAPIIHIDDFVSWTDFSGWWPRFEDQVLNPLLRGEPAHFQARDWAGDEFGTGLGEWRTVSWAPLVVIEGVTCTRRAAASVLCYRIWLDAPQDERLRRGIERDGETHRELWNSWQREEEAFFISDGTRARADMIVSGTEPGGGLNLRRPQEG